MSSAVTFAMALYFTSMLDQETVACLRELQETRLGSKNTTKPLVECQSSTQPAQSECIENQRWGLVDFQTAALENFR